MILIIILPCCYLCWILKSTPTAVPTARRQKRRPAGVPSALRYSPTDDGLRLVAEMARTRLILTNGRKQLGGGIPDSVPPSGRYTGTYEELGKSKHVSYRLNFASDGSVTGTCQDDDGKFNVKGIYDSKAALYRWGEPTPGAKYASLDHESSLYSDGIVAGRMFHVEVTMAYNPITTRKEQLRPPVLLTGRYFASTNVQGALILEKK